ncbi:MAG: response regulator transcription factor [Gammaproteobacteria bacterium]|nr:response regulator transcription factor [Gammaproteobacteria bacterium]MDH3410962.1 response regulator transcription factor [Gammaproteobacteria bacterium]
MTRNILIIEDSSDIADLLQLHIKDINCLADIAQDGEQGLRLFEQGRYDLVILDLMLPVMDGLAVCRRLRALPGYVPIIMLTSKSSELDRVVGLEMGADDYVTKPFSLPELLARVRAQFRRMEALDSTDTQSTVKKLVVGDLVIEFEKRRVLIDGTKVELTAKEFDLLSHFARHPGRVYTRAELLDTVWGYSYEGYEHTVNSHINRLRTKIENDPVNPRFILTVWGVGYKFADEEN